MWNFLGARISSPQNNPPGLWGSYVRVIGNKKISSMSSVKKDKGKGCIVDHQFVCLLTSTFISSTKTKNTISA